MQEFIFHSNKRGRALRLLCALFLLPSLASFALAQQSAEGQTLPDEGEAQSSTSSAATGSVFATSALNGKVVTAAAATSTVTNIAIDGSTKVSGAQRLGINLGGQTFYDSGQLLRNLVSRNPGFEGETFRTILHCAAATATTCTDTNIYAQWPANFVKGASYQFIYGKALGATGTVSASTAASYTGQVGVTISFAKAAKTPAKGDFVELQMTVPGNAQAGWWPSASGGAGFATDFSDLSPHSPGKQALRINASGSGQTAQLASYFDSFAGRSFVQLKGEYELAFRAKGLGGNNELTVTVKRLASTGTEIFFTKTITLTSAWQDYSFSFPASEQGKSIGTAALEFSVAQASMYLDDVSLAAVANSGNPTAFRDEVVSTLQTLHPGIIRYEDSNGAGLGGSIDNAIAPPFARVRTAYSQQETERDDITIGLHEFLKLCQTVGANPWYNVPVGVSPTEMKNLIEYLGGSTSTPYGAKRAALGQAAPWTSVFPKLYLELGNEVWNDAYFHGAAMQDPVAYGNRAATIFAAARSSASYESGKMNLILGSWAAVPYWTSTEMANSSGYDMVDAAPYLFNSFNNSSSNEAIYGPMFAQPESVDSVSTGTMYQQAVAAKAASTPSVKPAALAVYEVQLSTVTGTASQSAINSVVPSLGAGIAVIDHMLLMMRDLGVTVQNVFALPEYNNPFTNASGVQTGTTPLFGAVVDMGGQSNLRRPLFLAEQIVNGAILPHLLNTTVSGANPTWNQPLSTNDNIELKNAHRLQSFAFSDGGTKRSLILINLSRTEWLPVTGSGAGAPPADSPIAVSVLSSASLTDTNETSAKVKITNETLNGYTPGTVANLPPYSIVVLTWSVDR